MALLEAHRLKMFERDRMLFDVDHLRIYPNDRIGLVGKNGSGKTTLLMTLAGLKNPEEGYVTVRASFQYMPQFKGKHGTKSGGERTQKYLIHALSKQPELLLLDEPTTHLDTNHIEWLEKKLSRWPGAFVVVSHDRAFLDAICTTIWEIDAGKVNIYAGNYTDYANQKEWERKQHQLAYEKYVQKKKQLEEALRLKEQKAQRAAKAPKNVSASEAKITGAKPYFAKKQKKLHQTAKSIQTRLEKLEKVEKVKEEPPVKMDVLHGDTVKGKIVLRVQDLSGMMGSRLLWKPASFEVRGGDKLAVLGPNGCGKTTLLKKIVKQREGVSLSPSVKLGYFSQDLTVLCAEQTVLDNVRSTSKQDETLIRTVLGRLHFIRDDVYKPVGVLSGGERVKVALAKVFLSDVNVLILDEPTNYLDIAAVTALESLLKEYEGTLIFATHDRRLVQTVATRILTFEQGDIKLFDGPYRHYTERHARKNGDEDKEKRRLLVETKLTEVLSRLSLGPSEDLEREFERLLAEKKRLEGE